MVSAGRATGPRLTAASAAVLLAFGLAAYPAAFGGDQRVLLGLAGAGAVGLTAVAAAGLWPAAAGWGVGLLGIEYLASLYLAGDRLALATPIYAALLLLVAELVYLAAQLAVPVGASEPVLGRRLARLGLMLVLSLASGSTLLALALLPLRSSVPLTGLGVAAAVGALGLTLALARR